MIFNPLPCATSSIHYLIQYNLLLEFMGHQCYSQFTRNVHGFRAVVYMAARLRIYVAIVVQIPYLFAGRLVKHDEMRIDVVSKRNVLANSRDIDARTYHSPRKTNWPAKPRNGIFTFASPANVYDVVVRILNGEVMDFLKNIAVSKVVVRINNPHVL